MASRNALRRIQFVVAALARLDVVQEQLVADGARERLQRPHQPQRPPGSAARHAPAARPGTRRPRLPALRGPGRRIRAAARRRRPDAPRTRRRSRSRRSTSPSVPPVARMEVAVHERVRQPADRPSVGISAGKPRQHRGRGGPLAGVESRRRPRRRARAASPAGRVPRQPVWDDSRGSGGGPSASAACAADPALVRRHGSAAASASQQSRPGTCVSNARRWSGSVARTSGTRARVHGRDQRGDGRFVSGERWRQLQPHRASAGHRDPEQRRQVPGLDVLDDVHHRRIRVRMAGGPRQGRRVPRGRGPGSAMALRLHGVRRRSRAAATRPGDAALRRGRRRGPSRGETPPMTSTSRITATLTPSTARQ